MDLSIDKFIHERARLLILTHLATVDERELSFNALKSALDITAGNLSVQLKNLEEAGYVRLDKAFEHRKSVTRVSLSAEGYAAFMRYIDTMEKIIRSVRE